MTPNAKEPVLEVVAAGPPLAAAVVGVAAAPNWNVLPVVRGGADEELLLVVGGVDQLPKRDFTAAAGAAGGAAVTAPVEAVPADVLPKPEKEDGANAVLLVDALNTEGVALADGVEAVREGGCAQAAAVMTFPNKFLKFWRDVLLSKDAAAEEVLVVAAGKMGLKTAASRGLALPTDSELLAGGAVEVIVVEAGEAEGALT